MNFFIQLLNKHILFLNEFILNFLKIKLFFEQFLLASDTVSDQISYFCHTKFSSIHLRQFLWYLWKLNYLDLIQSLYQSIL